MATKVLVPRLGEGVEEVTVTKWLKKEGDAVKELEPLLEVNTDKVDTEIPAPASGTVLKIELQEGQPAKVGQLLAVIGAAGEKVDNFSPPAAPAAAPGKQAAPKTDTPEGEPPPPPATHHSSPSPRPPSHEAGFISPVVAKIAAEHGVNLGDVQGTGLNARITKNDVLNYVQSGKSSAPSAPPVARHPSPASEGDELIKHTTIRKQIADHMVMSLTTSPHVLTVMEADMSRVVAHRAAHKEVFARDGVNLTYTAYFISAIVAGLKAHPLTNSSWTDEGVLVHKAVNVGMAASLGAEGLIVPVIKNADDLSLLATARAVNDLASRARAKKLQPEEVRGGTFTLTNHGTAGSLFAMPIINQPQCGILGVGAMQKRVVAVSDVNGNDAVAVRPMIYLSFVFDHRILDGASADAFLAKIKETLEDWA
jgi:pyruvate/2-oxoglutarate dehydrogenase complex dihydrolipoamide acyltransferase (E2) component